ncbi:MAG: hypothetical protein M1823_004198 [Watsoniomyces obsoletus]|nr:MAG: hypothetical protein M1823_004198 [Watsoniomyces obsoletus]
MTVDHQGDRNLTGCPQCAAWRMDRVDRLNRFDRLDVGLSLDWCWRVPFVHGFWKRDWKLAWELLGNDLLKIRKLGDQLLTLSMLGVSMLAKGRELDECTHPGWKESVKASTSHMCVMLDLQRSMGQGHQARIKPVMLPLNGGMDHCLAFPFMFWEAFGGGVSFDTAEDLNWMAATQALTDQYRVLKKVWDGQRLKDYFDRTIRVYSVVYGAEICSDPTDLEDSSFHRRMHIRSYRLLVPHNPHEHGLQDAWEDIHDIRFFDQRLPIVLSCILQCYQYVAEFLHPVWEEATRLLDLHPNDGGSNEMSDGHRLMYEQSTALP